MSVKSLLALLIVKEGCKYFNNSQKNTINTDNNL